MGINGCDHWRCQRLKRGRMRSDPTVTFEFDRAHIQSVVPIIGTKQTQEKEEALGPQHYHGVLAALTTTDGLARSGDFATGEAVPDKVLGPAWLASFSIGTYHHRPRLHWSRMLVPASGTTHDRSLFTRERTSNANVLDFLTVPGRSPRPRCGNNLQGTSR